MAMNMEEMKDEPAVHVMHTMGLKRRLVVCLVLTVPVLVLSQAIQTWFHYTITLPYQPFSLLGLAAVIYVYGGWPFLTGLVQELRKPSME